MEDRKKRMIESQSSDNQVTLLNRLPELVLANLISFLDIKDAGRLCRVSTHFNRVITKNNPQLVGVNKFKQFLSSQLVMVRDVKCDFEWQFPR